MGIFIALIAIVPVAVILLLIWRGRAEYRSDKLRRRDLSSLSEIDAEHQATAILQDARYFGCVESPLVSTPHSELLPPALRNFFGRYESVESKTEPSVRLERNSIMPSQLHADYMRIGRGLEGTDVEFEIGFKPGSDEIFELYKDEAPDETYGKYKSIYHFLLANSLES
jgi:hypothetical protein